MRNIKLTLEYDGSKFFGFQRQTDKPTIQAALEEALSKLFDQPMKIAAAAGRTDSGVHARGQVVNFRVDSPLSLNKIQTGLNALLPYEIVVTQAEEAPGDFHARYGAKAKTYEYLVLNSRLRSPLLNGRAYRFPYPLDLAKMKKAARKLVGCHDFKAFQAAGSNVKSSRRFVHRLTIERKRNLIRFIIEADGFLYHMVRNIVGTLLEVGRGSLAGQDFLKVFRSRKRVLAGPTVPAEGLTLVSVDYGPA